VNADPASCEGDFTVQRELGLHARPAGRFVALATRFASDIQVTRAGSDDEWVSGRSVLSLLSLGASRGTRLRVRAVGSDAAEAVAALGRILEEPNEPEPLPSAPGRRA
jgi:phosphotransferase system HPr (HPr) family protein